MPYALGGTGYLGLSYETTYGTYVAPSIWIPIRSESFAKTEDKIYRTNIRGLADRSGAIQGYYHIEGDIEFEVSADLVLPFFYASRMTPAKSGAGPYVYTFTGAHVASPTTGTGATTRRTLAIVVNRNSRYFSYTGMSVTRLSFRVDGGLLMCTATLMGLEEAQQAGPFTPSWPTQNPFGPTYNSIELPTATVRTDIDTFTLDIDDGGDAMNRIKTTGGRAPAFIQWGEREVTLSVEHDFDALTDYNAFLAQTKQAIKWVSNESAGNQLTFLTNATVTDSYTVNLGGIGDLVRASVSYHGIYDTTDVLTITCTSTVSVV